LAQKVPRYCTVVVDVGAEARETGGSRDVRIPNGDVALVMERAAMSRTFNHDVVIRSRSAIESPEFTVVCDKTARLLGGPFSAMADALACAEALVNGEPRRILYEAYDERGRAIGDRLVLRAAGA
jgi:hypothetical protein